MTQRPSIHTRGILVKIPDNILARYANVTLSADIMEVNGVKFLITHLRHMCFTTSELLTSLHNNMLLEALFNVCKIYRKRGFMVRTMMMDGAFESLRGALAEKNIEPSICSENEHVGEIKQTNCTIKERCRGIYNTLPFTKLPGRLVAELVHSTVFWLNAFHPAEDLLDNMSPRTIITGRTIDFLKHCKHEFGDYVQTHESTDNTMAPRTIAALALRPTGNKQGGWFYLSLSTGRKINRLHATVLPMPDHVIDRVHRMARRNKSGITFRNRNNDIIPDDNDNNSDNDSDYEPTETNSIDSNNNSSSSLLSSNDDNDDNAYNVNEVDDGPIDDGPVDTGDAQHSLPITGVNKQNNVEPSTEQDDQITGVTPETDQTTNVADNTITETVEDRIDQIDNHMDAIEN